MRAYRQILLAPWHRQIRIWGFESAATGLVAVSLALAWWGMDWRGLQLVAPCVVMVLCLMWWAQFDSLVQQNDPTAARLVPGQLRRLRSCAVGLWLPLVLTQALVLGAAFGHASAWLLSAAGTMLLTAMLLARPVWTVVALIAVPCLLLVTGTPPWQAVPPWWKALTAWQSLGVLGTSLAVSAWLLGRLLRNGGPKHVRRVVIEEAMALDGFFAYLLNRLGSPGQLLNHTLQAPYRAWLRYLLTHTQLTPRSVLARAEMAIGPTAHWTSVFKNLGLFIVYAGLVFGVHYATQGGNSAQFMTAWSLPMTVTALFLVAGSVEGQAEYLYRRRHEQALLVLLPGMPQGANLNQGLALRQMAHFGLAWALVAGLTWFFYSQYLALATPAALGYTIASMPLGLLNWCDLSRQGPHTDIFKKYRIPQSLLLPIGFGLGVVPLLIRWGTPPWQLFTAMLAITLAIGTWRWRKLAHYPQALPVGRLWQSN